MTPQAPNNPDKWQPILDQLRKPGGLALGFLAIALALVTIFVLPQWQVPAQVLACLIIVGLAYVWISAAALREAKFRINLASDQLAAHLEKSISVEPKVIQSMSHASDTESIILLLQPSRLFGQSMLVSIYYEDEREFEILIATGRVSNIQTNGLIQITIEDWESPDDNIRRSVGLGEVEKLGRLLVRPAPIRSPIAPDAQQILKLLELSGEKRGDDGE